MSSTELKAEDIRWNLADLYPSLAAWEADAARLDGQFKAFAACRGHLGDSAQRLRDCLDQNAEMRKRFYRMAVYAGEQLSEDTGVRSRSPVSGSMKPCGHAKARTPCAATPLVARYGWSVQGRAFCQITTARRAACS